MLVFVITGQTAITCGFIGKRRGFFRQTQQITPQMNTVVETIAYLRGCRSWNRVYNIRVQYSRINKALPEYAHGTGNAMIAGQLPANPIRGFRGHQWGVGGHLYMGSGTLVAVWQLKTVPTNMGLPIIGSSGVVGVLPETGFRAFKVQQMPIEYGALG